MSKIDDGVRTVRILLIDLAVQMTPEEMLSFYEGVKANCEKMIVLINRERKEK